eukprot:GEMP01033583.1.p1 GENE.GEMP01033583.1~~GEMP01033583.1.p1  ORF type:complete len:262 (+),score=63.16 GEMP01033583.1:202-987(+)
MHRNVLRRIPFPSGEVIQFGCLQDNYGYLLRHKAFTIAIDVPDGPVYVALAKRNQWNITHCLLTHHHHDHAGGVPEVREAFPDVQVIGSEREKAKLPALEHAVTEGDTFTVGDMKIQILGVPGHTLGHIAYYMPDEKMVFVGDSVFVMGCGRIFEGDPEMMLNSIDKIKNLPGDTQLFCGHEYTAANGRFAQSVDTQNEDLTRKMAEVHHLREAGTPTVPSTIDAERQTNPFFRAQQLAKTVGALTELESFTILRRKKDCF